MYTCTDRQQRQCLAVSEFMYLFLFNLFECDKYSWMYRVWLFQVTSELQTVVWDCNNNVAVMLLLLWDEEAQAGYLQTVFLCTQTAQTLIICGHTQDTILKTVVLISSEMCHHVFLKNKNFMPTLISVTHLVTASWSRDACHRLLTLYKVDTTALHSVVDRTHPPSSFLTDN